VAAHLGAVSVVTTTWLYTQDPVLTFYVGGCLIAVTYLALAVFEMRRAPVLISPLSFYFLWYSCGLGLAAVSIAGRVAAHETIRLGSFEVRPNDLAYGYVLVLLGSVAFHFGAQITRPLKRRSCDTDALTSTGARRYPILLVFIWALGVVARLFGSPATLAGAVFGILVWASNAALCAYCLSSSPLSPRLSWLLLIAGCLIEVVCNLGSFSKAYIMYSFVPILWTCVYFRVYRIWLIPMGIALAVFYLVIVAPVVSTAREEGRLNEEDTPTDRLLRNYTNYTVGDSNIFVETEKFFERQFDAIPAGFIHREVEKYGLRFGDTMEYLEYAFIPRLFWPDKPTVTRGAWFTVYLGGAGSEEEATTATALTAAGELYWNFGLWGVIAGMTLVGALVGAAWRVAGAKPYVDPLRMLLYFATCIWVVDNAEAGVMTVGISHRLLVLGSLIWFWDLTTRRLVRDGGANSWQPRIAGDHRLGTTRDSIGASQSNA
jgi:hypothetical protein